MPSQNGEASTSEQREAEEIVRRVSAAFSHRLEEIMGRKRS